MFTCDALRPIEIATPEIIDKVHDIVLTDQVCELVEAISILHGTVISILRTIGYEKVISKMDTFAYCGS